MLMKFLKVVGGGMIYQTTPNRGGMPDSIQERYASHEQMMRSQISVIYQFHPVELSIEFQYLLTSFGDLQEYIILIFSFFSSDAGRT